MDELNNTKTMPGQSSTVTEPATADKETAEKTYTETEMQSLIDKRVAQALATQERKNNAKLREAERLAKMSESEKYEYELSQREQKILEKERELVLAENRNIASQILSEKGLSLKLVDFVLADDADEMDRKIKLLDLEFKKSLKTEIEKRLGGNAPKTTALNTTGITQEQFRKMTLDERARLAKNDRDQYEMLMGRLK